MGFNARLAPFSITRTIEVRESSKDRNANQNFPLFKFPADGQIVGAYANVRRNILATGPDVAVEATTNTGVDEVNIWKFATADTTATYATALRACYRTGAQDTSSAAAPGINWRLATTSGVDGLYTLTNKSATRRKFLAGDVAMLHISAYAAATDAHIGHTVDLQFDYVIGHED